MTTAATHGPASPKRVDLRREGGFTLTEMMVAAAIMLTVTGAVFQLMNPAQGIFKAQPEVADMQQRLRVAVETLRGDLVMAGAGSYAGASPGSLYNFFAPVLPYRWGDTASDPAAGVFYRKDAITLIYIPPTPAQTSIEKAMPANSAELDVYPQNNCGANKKDSLCGFKEGQRLIIMDPNGSWDTFTVTNVQAAPSKIQHNKDKLNGSYGQGATVAEIATHTYYLKADNATKTYQLMHYDGYKTDLPVVDNVVKLEFEYFGDAQPPQLLPPGPNTCLSSCSGPWVTYGPKPPDVATDFNTGDEYGKGENCTFTNTDGAQAPRLQVLAEGNVQVKLDPATFQDGPWCPSATSPIKFDADLLRIRHVRAKLRVQVGLESLRGPAGIQFVNGGTSMTGERLVPDQEITFDVSPRNMNLGR